MTELEKHRKGSKAILIKERYDSVMEVWPELPFEAWKDTRDTLHSWLQIVGKVKLELCPFLNQWWEVTFYVTPRGLTTSLIPLPKESFSVDFDFIAHQLRISVSDGQVKELTLEPRTVADFYHLFMDTLASMGIEVKINSMPAEVQNGIKFEEDTTHSSYDKEYVQNWWRIMLATSRVMEQYRESFHGKNSPVQFFWGGFDLNQSRFNGKPATPPNYGGRIMEYGENAENFAIGFWPGTDQFPYAAFYSYMSPAPSGIATAQVKPTEASFDTKMGEFILRYDTVRTSASPEETLASFFESTYAASAALAGWDRQALEGQVPTLNKKLK